MVKPDYGQPIDAYTYNKTKELFEKLLQLIHPFMPFITEELYHELKNRSDKECIIVSQWPNASAANNEAIQNMNILMDVISNVRNIRNTKQLSKEDKPVLFIKTQNIEFYKSFEKTICKLSLSSGIEGTNENIDGAASFIVKADEFFIPLNLSAQDIEKERERIVKDLEYTKGFLSSIEKKLSNERFVQNAPEAVLANERQKQADAVSKIAALEKSLLELQ
jgi:valyl-tRNA synthetase